MTISRILSMCGLPTPDGTDDTAEFLVDETLRLVFHVPEGGAYLHLRAVIAELPRELHVAKSVEIATANYNGALTGGGALGLNPESGQVVLFMSLPCDALAADIMQSIVSRFVDTAFFWISRLLPAGETPPARPDTAGSIQSWIQG